MVDLIMGSKGGDMATVAYKYQDYGTKIPVISFRTRRSVYVLAVFMSVAAVIGLALLGARWSLLWPFIPMWKTRSILNHLEQLEATHTQPTDTMNLLLHVATWIPILGNVPFFLGRIFQ